MLQLSNTNNICFGQETKQLRLGRSFIVELETDPFGDGRDHVLG
jgi:hypothetical protein